MSSSLNHRTDKGLAPARGLQDATRDRAVHERPTRATDMGTGQQGWEKQEQTKRKTNGWKFEREALFCGPHMQHHGGPVRATTGRVATGASSKGGSSAGPSSGSTVRRSSSASRRVSTGSAGGVEGTPKPSAAATATYHVVNCPAASVESKGDASAPVVAGAKYEVCVGWGGHGGCLAGSWL